MLIYFKGPDKIYSARTETNRGYYGVQYVIQYIRNGRKSPCKNMEIENHIRRSFAGCVHVNKADVSDYGLIGYDLDYNTEFTYRRPGKINALS